MVPVLSWVTGPSLMWLVTTSMPWIWSILWHPLPCPSCNQREGIWDGKRGWSKYHKSVHNTALLKWFLQGLRQHRSTRRKSVLLGGCHSFCILAGLLVPFNSVAPSGWCSLLQGSQASHERQAGNENAMSGVAWCQHPLLQQTKWKEKLIGNEMWGFTRKLLGREVIRPPYKLGR